MSGLEENTLPGEAYPGLDAIAGYTAGVLRSRIVGGWVLEENASIVRWAFYVLGSCSRPVPGSGAGAGLDVLGYYRIPCRGTLGVALDAFDILSVSKPTPLVRLRVPRGWPVVWAKLEWFNPYSLSVKDRVAREIMGLLQTALGSKQVRGVTEASSGNTGVAVAALASLMGVEARVFLSSAASDLIVNVLRLLGARVERGDGGSTIELSLKALGEAVESGLAFANQVGSDFNFIAHVRGTGRELVAQLENAGVEPTALVLGSGTGGTAGGVGFTLYNYYYGSHSGPPRIYAVAPSHGERIEGLRPLAGGRSPWLSRVGVPHESIEVSRRKALQHMVWAARSNGLVVGVSSGAVLAGIERLVREDRLGGDDIVVTVFPDTGFKYPHAVEESLSLFEGEWDSS